MASSSAFRGAACCQPEEGCRGPSRPAELREKIKNGQVTLEYVLDSDDPAATRMPVRALIESLPGYGKAKAAKIMDEPDSPARASGLAASVRPSRDPLEVVSRTLSCSSSRPHTADACLREGETCLTLRHNELALTPYR